MRTTDIQRLADEEVMLLLRDGNPDAFEVIYDRHGGAAFSLAYRMVGDRNVAEDITQEAFLSMWRSRVRFDRERGHDPEQRDRQMQEVVLGVDRDQAED